ncbi:hypothetical protein CC85DRAFT_311184 [Cutaneotrichosporon oleaginosum]|uniref:PH domain-containing protein n=1 Tax=Cutaneotrichosporon oleaginosum TaxID=879819 RepID=A0A0J0XTL2_9TREE|nr:uncharacterized protein CC85DRAFT_311184 [Cutaneotrichosporon oleaginosum]KLT44407.1 hypothetical protein CC85DRAFT_311184 [Cutaneotrichosporon oleaginosum]TXT07872.1 hypothetical protein COLE_04796 [Cutaneotrichosporon oleaginosum]
MPSLFRQKRRSTISTPGATTPLGTPPNVEVTVEPLALHKLRTLLHRGSRLSLRLGGDDSRPQSVRLPTPDPAKAHSEPPALAHKPDSGSASTTPPSELTPLSEPEPEAVVHNPTTTMLADNHTHPEPRFACPATPPQNPASLTPSPATTRPPKATSAPSPTRPPLTIDTNVASPSSSPFHTPHASAPPSPELHFATPEPSSPAYDARIGSDAVALAMARRRSSAVSAMSAVSAHSVGSPLRMAAILHSPPMPIPIARLPSLNGGGCSPGWGALALQGGPHSPALSRVNSRASTSGGFPFPHLATPSRNNSKELTDAEVRRATKTMPVMLRVPSHQPPVEPEEEEEEDDEDDSADGHGGTAPPLAQAPPPAQSAYVNRSGRNLVMDPVTEESRSGTPLPGSRTTSSLGSPPSQRPHGFFDHDRLPSGPDDTPSSLGLHSVQSSGTSHPEVEDDASSLEGDSLDSASVDDNASGSVALTSIATPSPATPPSAPRRPVLYTQTSQSMINLSTPHAERTVAPATESPEALQTVDELPTTTPALDRDWAHPPTTPWGVTSPPPLKRRLSAGDADPAPPRYESVRMGRDGPAVRPREEEGCERLPPYWCGVHIEGTLSRKMEFVQPGVQARDRGWKKHYFVLHGTALFVYKFDPTKVPLRMGEPYLTADETESQEYLHVHLAPDHHRASVSTPNPVQAIKQARRATVGQEGAPRINVIATAISNARRGTIGSSTPPRREGAGGKDPTLFEIPKRRQSSSADSVASSTASAPIASHMPFAHNQLLHVYSMHGAESGLAADYKKRLHCVRVRAEGQQFMLQTDTARQCVQWIEAFQASTNVAMDLDTRPMPVQQTLPRRRRRRRVQTEPAAPAAAAAAETSAPFSDTPEGNIAAVIAAERAETKRERMLAEDQQAEADGRFRT